MAWAGGEDVCSQFVSFGGCDNQFKLQNGFVLTAKNCGAPNFGLVTSTGSPFCTLKFTPADAIACSLGFGPILYITPQWSC